MDSSEGYCVEAYWVQQERIAVVLRSAEFLGESDEKPFRPADIAEAIRVFILGYVA